jgi:hypothetical protein
LECRSCYYSTRLEFFSLLYNWLQMRVVCCCAKYFNSQPRNISRSCLLGGSLCQLLSRVIKIECSLTVHYCIALVSALTGSTLLLLLLLQDGRTPLTNASFYPHVEVVAQLLAAGATLEASSFPANVQTKPAAQEAVSAVLAQAQAKPAAAEAASGPAQPQAKPARGEATSSPAQQEQAKPAAGEAASVPAQAQAKLAVGEAASVSEQAQAKLAAGEAASVPKQAQAKPEAGVAASVPAQAHTKPAAREAALASARAQAGPAAGGAEPFPAASTKATTRIAGAKGVGCLGVLWRQVGVCFAGGSHQQGRGRV